MERRMTKEEMMDAVKKWAAELGHAPSFAEFRRHAALTRFLRWDKRHLMIARGIPTA